MSLEVVLPAPGEVHWGPKLNTAIDEIVDYVNELAFEAGGDVGRTFSQPTPAANWVIPFPASIARLPAVTVRDLAGNVVGVDHVADLATRTVTIAFPVPVAGTATLN